MGEDVLETPRVEGRHAEWGFGMSRARGQWWRGALPVRPLAGVTGWGGVPESVTVWAGKWREACDPGKVQHSFSPLGPFGPAHLQQVAETGKGSGCGEGCFLGE